MRPVQKQQDCLMLIRSLRTGRRLLVCREHPLTSICPPTTAPKISMQLELKNVNIRAGDQLKVKGVILHDAERFEIDLGCGAEDLALHFNPRFHDNTDGAVLVCNSKADGCWGSEKREIHNSLHRGKDVRMVLKLTGDMFEVDLPDGHEVQFPNRGGMDIISYIKIAGDFKLTSLKIC
ncbi:galectin-2-like isoform X1 [Pungitius pungitius]|uniref:galectin-2-like isoform X1 n=2 Tax=Pungitius pungitius TaxID=134920 RepID=UPI002E141E99